MASITTRIIEKTSAIQCNAADLDGYLPITTPQYGSLQPLELELKLKGGVGHGMFQPKALAVPIAGVRASPSCLQRILMTPSAIKTTRVTLRIRRYGPQR